MELRVGSSLDGFHFGLSPSQKKAASDLANHLRQSHPNLAKVASQPVESEEGFYVEVKPGRMRFQERTHLRTFAVSLLNYAAELGWENYSCVHIPGNISEIRYQGGGLNLEANASFKNNGELNQVILNRLEFGQTDVKAIVAPHNDPRNEGWNIHVSGKRLFDECRHRAARCRAFDLG